jgi:hypothetical protein
LYVQVLVGAVGTQHLFIGASGGAGDRLVCQIGIVLDARGFLRQESGSGKEMTDRKCHFFAPGRVVGG